MQFSIQDTPRPSPANPSYDVQHVKQAVRLTDVAKIIFPEHDTIAFLKKELSLMNDVLMKRIWLDNCPKRVKYELHCLNKLVYKCKCLNCVSVGELRRECEFWRMVLQFLNHTGLTYSFPSKTVGKIVFCNRKLAVLTNVPSHTPSLHYQYPRVHYHYLLDYTSNPDFDEENACAFLSPVSDVDVHIAFDTSNCAFEFKYGRKLWNHSNITSLAPELKKLDFFRVHVRVGV